MHFVPSQRFALTSNIVHCSLLLLCCFENVAGQVSMDQFLGALLATVALEASNMQQH
jgi:hypothetical protein